MEEEGKEGGVGCSRSSIGTTEGRTCQGGGGEERGKEEGE